MKSIPYFPFRNKNNCIPVKEHKSNWRKINPSRYLYHLTYRHCGSENDLMLDRMSYILNGICGIDKGLYGVWANNQIGNINRLWPIAIDSWDCNTRFDFLKMYYGFDVWRIDTSVIDNIWYVDPNLMHEHWGGSPSDYLYTENSIHPRGLKLFTFLFNDYRFLYEEKKDVEFSLVPEKKINDFIFSKWRSNK